MTLEYHLTGTVINGELRLDNPVPLPNGTRVRITITPIHERSERLETQPQSPAPVELSFKRPDEMPDKTRDA